ncbi:hypothetical protein [Ornithinimicrobium sp. INDO-MA30-4]|uniref:hypothetical protein n=1 Tax=Ornithinimicrobium sp. INDO-MA30-4 TaxID=2908651 RepID=UPI001F488A5D|nr:hypothetical protein [Ornithinimicrobium sp. INDO-MA30-4]UJH69983.1 hypothetical protein L0A91_12245 [Ornithinimicrobium sp. INDO-MA30-4]
MLGRKPATAGAIFGQLCLSRAGLKSVDSVHDSRRVIEVSQQFTTHNLAILLDAGVHPQTPWFELALSAGQTTAELLLRVPRSPNPQTTLRNAGYAWRQALFFLKCAGEERAPEFMTRLKPAKVRQIGRSARCSMDLILSCTEGDLRQPTVRLLSAGWRAGAAIHMGPSGPPHPRIRDASQAIYATTEFL